MTKYAEYDSIVEENEPLKQENYDLRQQLVDYDKLKAENEAFRDLNNIREQNPAPVGPVSHDRRIPELERGIGHHILRELAGKYDGSFTFEAKDGEFRADLFLKERGVTA